MYMCLCVYTICFFMCTVVTMHDIIPKAFLHFSVHFYVKKEVIR